MFFWTVSDEIEELSYAKRDQNVFDSEISQFVSTELLEKEINETFESKAAALDENDEFYDAEKNSLDIQRNKELDGVLSMKFSKKKYHKKNTIREIDEKIKEAEKDPKTKTIIEFDNKVACSIKGFAVKQNNSVKPTTRFFSGKMLMFAKISLISFIYGMIEIFCFSNNKIKQIYQKYFIDLIYPYHILNDTILNSTLLSFIFFCKPESSIPNEKYRDCLFEVVKANEVPHRFDTSHEFWENLSARDKSFKKY